MFAFELVNVLSVVLSCCDQRCDVGRELMLMCVCVNVIFVFELLSFLAYNCIVGCLVLL